MNRRDLLRNTFGLGALSISPTLYALNRIANALNAPLHAPSSMLKAPRFKIGACDWSISSMAKLEAFDIAKQIGLDGVQVSLLSKADEVHLRSKEMQEAYLAASKRTGVAIGGLALGILNEVPYKSEPQTEQWVQDSVDVAKALGVKAILLAFFGKGDLKNDPQGQKVVIERLKAVAPKAEKAGVTLGIESWLSAPEHLAIIDAVGSSAVKVYYDVCNSTVMKYDIYKEIRDLRRNQICEFHFKENGYLIGKGELDYKAIRRVLDDIEYKGWIQIEGAIPKDQPMLESYIANNKFVRELLS